MTALLPAQVQVSLDHFLDYIAVAHFRAHNFSAEWGECFVESEIAHDRGDERFLLQMARFQ